MRPILVIRLLFDRRVPYLYTRSFTALDTFRLIFRLSFYGVREYKLTLLSVFGISFDISLIDDYCFCGFRCYGDQHCLTLWAVELLGDINGRYKTRPR